MSRAIEAVVVPIAVNTPTTAHERRSAKKPGPLILAWASTPGASPDGRVVVGVMPWRSMENPAVNNTPAFTASAAM